MSADLGDQSLGKPPFEMCWFYMGIAQIALDPCVKRANVEKSAPNHPGKPLHPWATWEISAPNHPGKPSHPPPLYGLCPYEGNTFQKGAPHNHDGQ